MTDNNITVNPMVVLGNSEPTSPSLEEGVLENVTFSEYVRRTIKGRFIVPGREPPDEGKAMISVGCASFIFPLCNPNGCEDPTVAPIHCENCRKIETELMIFGMFLLSIGIVVANFLVIRVILRNPSLRRRHGYIKLSMATSDLLVGLFVIPAAIVNVFLTLYYPRSSREGEDEVDEHRKDHRNSTESVIFGVVVVISVTSSLYNLLLLSADRFLAIARPLKHRANKYFPNKSLFYSISSVWILAVALSMVPAFFPKKVYYEMDLATFFYVQRVNSSSGSVFSPVYIGVIIGGPYILTVLLIILTAAFTWKNLRIRNRLSKRGGMSKSAIQRKDERKNRIKMIQEAYPDALMEDDMNVASIKDYGSNTDRGGPKASGWRRNSSNSESRCWLSWWKSDDCVFGNRTQNSNNNSNGMDASPRYQRTRDQMSIVREILNPPKTNAKKFNRRTHVRVFKMLTTMLVCFSVCLLPYVIVMLKIADPLYDCSSMTSAYIFAMYLLFMNSFMNFIIYNFLHPEFRHRLVKILREDCSRPGKIMNSVGTKFSASEQSASNRDDSRIATGTTSFT